MTASRSTCHVELTKEPNVNKPFGFFWATLPLKFLLLLLLLANKFDLI